MDISATPLLTDLYQFTMLQAYLDAGTTETAVFEFHVRTFPARRGFLLAAGLEQALDFLESVRFSPADLDWLQSTGLINILNFQSLIAAKAARMKLAAPGKTLVDFGLRRAHGAEAGLLAARASYIAGLTGSATVLANKLFGIPIFGTMAHSFIEAYDDETIAFETFARSRPKDVVLLIDTYDTKAAARKVVTLATRLQAAG